MTRRPFTLQENGWRRFTYKGVALAGVAGLMVGVAIGNRTARAPNAQAATASQPADSSSHVTSNAEPEASRPVLSPIDRPKRDADGRWTPIDGMAKAGLMLYDTVEMGLEADFGSARRAHGGHVVWLRKINPVEEDGQTGEGDHYREKSTVQQWWIDCASRRWLALHQIAYDAMGNVTHSYDSPYANADLFSADAAQQPVPDTYGEAMLDGVCKHYARATNDGR
jgi:hypothetical protein